MRIHKIRIFVAAAASLACGLSFGQGTADYPNKPVRVIVAFAAGGGADAQTRMFAQKMSENMKRQFVVENRTGGGGSIAYAYTAKSAPDGYTLLAVSPTFTIAPALHQNLTYDAVADFAPISLMSRAPYLVLAHPSLPLRSIQNLIALARAKPGALNMGVTTGGSTHLATAYFADAARIKVTIVSYKGTAQAMLDTLSGQIHLFFGNVVATLPHVKSGRLRVLGVSSTERSSVLPELPTIAESGLRGFDVSTWQGWAAPAGTPAPIINKLSEELARVSRSPIITKILVEDGGEPVGSPPEPLRKLIADEVPRWRKVVQELGVRAE